MKKKKIRNHWVKMLLYARPREFVGGLWIRDSKKPKQQNTFILLRANNIIGDFFYFCFYRYAVNYYYLRFDNFGLHTERTFLKETVQKTRNTSVPISRIQCSTFSPKTNSRIDNNIHKYYRVGRRRRLYRNTRKKNKKKGKKTKKKKNTTV